MTKVFSNSEKEKWPSRKYNKIREFFTQVNHIKNYYYFYAP